MLSEDPSIIKTSLRGSRKLIKTRLTTSDLNNTIQYILKKYKKNIIPHSCNATTTIPNNFIHSTSNPIFYFVYDNVNICN